MTFPPELVRKVLAGQKTEARVPVRRGGFGERCCPYRVGHDYPVQRDAAGEAEARILVHAIDLAKLRDVTDADARAEGFRTRADFFTHWRRLYLRGAAAARRDLLVRLAAANHPVPKGALHPGLPESVLRTRLRALHDLGLAGLADDGWIITIAGRKRLADPLSDIDLDQEVWVVRFELDRRRLLVPATSRRRGVGDYTNDPREAMPDEPEAVDPAELGRYADEARNRDAQRRRDQDARVLEAEHRLLTRRVESYERLARDRGVDVRSELRVVKARLEAIDRKIRQQRPAA